MIYKRGHEHIIIGITSWCSDEGKTRFTKSLFYYEGKTTHFTSVAYYRDWIEKTIQRLKIFRDKYTDWYEAQKKMNSMYISILSKKKRRLLCIGLAGVVKKNTEIGTIESWGPHFLVSFDVKINSHLETNRSSILDFKGNGGTRDCCKHGDRIPAVLHDERNNELIFCSSVNGNGNYHVKYKVELHRWYTIIIKQILTLRQVRIKIDAKDLNNTHFTRFTLLSELMEKNSSKLKIKIPRHFKTSRFLLGTISCQQQMHLIDILFGKMGM